MLRVIAKLLTILFFINPTYITAETASGYAYIDTNNNALLDEGEQGIAKVAVSNGRDVVQTDEKGFYTLPVEPGDIIFITKPANYETPVSEGMIRRFYYIHAPEGTPKELDLMYPGIEPTGPLPEHVNFSLRPKQEPDTFKVIWFADTQPQSFAELEFYRDDVLNELAGTTAAFGITAGDVMFDDMSLFPRYIELTAQLGIPWHNVPGNHELNFKSPDDKFSLETFKRYFGPSYYSFDYAQTHFVILDNVYYFGNDNAKESPDPRGRGKYKGFLDADQLQWLEQDLKYVSEDKLIVFAMHVPLNYYVDPERESVVLQNREDLFKLLAGRKYLFSAAGHTHVAEHHYFGKDRGFNSTSKFHHQVLSTVSGSWWSGPMDERGIPVTEQRDGTPNGYYIMTVKGNNYSMRFKAARRPADFQMRITLDTAFHYFRDDAQRYYTHGSLINSPILLDQLPSAELYVNLFNGGENSTVEYSINGYETVKMKRVFRHDPYTNDLFIHHRAAIKSWVKPQPSPHLWVAKLPQDLKPGVYTIRVKATDEYGEVHQSSKIIELFGR
ncbi:MAG: calcineurin-like phosphoesterase family protein [Pseudomonadota bacterium]